MTVRLSATPLDSLFVGVNEIDERLDVVSVCQAGLFFAHLETGDAFRIVLLWSAEHPISMGGLNRFRLIGMHPDPIANLTISNGFGDYVHELFAIYACGFEP